MWDKIFIILCFDHGTIKKVFSDNHRKPLIKKVPEDSCKKEFFKNVVMIRLSTTPTLSISFKSKYLNIDHESMVIEYTVQSLLMFMDLEQT